MVHYLNQYTLCVWHCRVILRMLLFWVDTYWPWHLSKADASCKKRVKNWAYRDKCKCLAQVLINNIFLCTSRKTMWLCWRTSSGISKKWLIHSIQDSFIWSHFFQKYFTTKSWQLLNLNGYLTICLSVHLFIQCI